MVSIDIGKITLPHSNCINYKQTTKKNPKKTKTTHPLTSVSKAVIFPHWMKGKS